MILEKGNITTINSSPTVMDVLTMLHNDRNVVTQVMNVSLQIEKITFPNFVCNGWTDGQTDGLFEL